MSYNIYTTEAVILKKRDLGEADRLYSFLTKDFGRIEVVAQGVRYLKSKLRYSLSGFSFLRIAFVATSNEHWRLVNAEEVCVWDSVRKNSEKMKCLSGIFSLIDRLVRGQEQDIELWEKLKNIFLFLEKNEFKNNGFKNFEITAALRILEQQGYLEKGKEYADPILAIQHALEQSQL